MGSLHRRPRRADDVPGDRPPVGGLSQALYACRTLAAPIPEVASEPPSSVSSSHSSDEAPQISMRMNLSDVNLGARTALRCSGAHIQSLTYKGVLPKTTPAPHLVSWVQSFVAHCTGLRELDLADMEMPQCQLVVESVARRLDSLTLYVHVPVRMDR